MKRTWCNKLVIAVTLVAFVCAPTLLHAQGAVTPAPASTNSIMNFLTGFFDTIDDPSDPMNWVAYSAIGTVFFYKTFFRGSIDFAKGTRDGMLRKLEDLKLSNADKKKIMNEINDRVRQVERGVVRAERAIPILDKTMSDGLMDAVIRSRIPNQNVPIDGLKGYRKLEVWLTSSEGAAFLATDAGERWRNRYVNLKRITSSDIDLPLSLLVTKANELFPSTQPFQHVESSMSQGEGLPGQFQVRNDFTHDRRSVPLSQLPKLARNMRDRCAIPYRAAAMDEAGLAAATPWSKFWLRARHRNPAIKGGIASAGALLGTYWLVRAVGYQQRRAEEANLIKQNGDAAADIYGWLSGPEGRTAMAPYYAIFLQTLREHRQELIDMFESELTEDEKKKFDIAKLIDETLKTPVDENGVIIVPDELISAAGAAAKKHQGDRTAPKALMDFITNAKKDRSTREGLFRAFNKDVLMGFVNKKWPDLTVGDPSDHFKKGTMRSIQNRVVELLEDDKKIKAPPPTQVPPAPGTTPPVLPAHPVGDNTVGPTGVNQVTLVPPQAPIIPPTATTAVGGVTSGRN